METITISMPRGILQIQSIWCREVLQIRSTCYICSLCPAISPSLFLHELIIAIMISCSEFIHGVLKMLIWTNNYNSAWTWFYICKSLPVWNSGSARTGEDGGSLMVYMVRKDEERQQNMVMQENPEEPEGVSWSSWFDSFVEKAKTNEVSNK